MPETNPLYLRKWRILVMDGDRNALDVSSLRCEFIIDKVMLQSANYAEVTIYNLTPDTEAAIIKEGMKIIVEAGYENGNYGPIFKGDVFQPQLDRENGTDYKLTLNCFDGDKSLFKDFVDGSVSAGYNCRAIVAEIQRKSRTGMQVGTISSGLSDSKAPRGKVLFGKPSNILRDIAKGNNAQFYVNDGLVEIAKVTDVPKGMTVTVSPQSGLIGTPMQTDKGFTFRCLINPSIRLLNPPMLVKIDNALIRQMKIMQQGERRAISPLDNDLIGQVTGLHITGDTRGTDWYMDVICVNRGGASPLNPNNVPLPDMVNTGKENTN